MISAKFKPCHSKMYSLGKWYANFNLKYFLFCEEDNGIYYYGLYDSAIQFKLILKSDLYSEIEEYLKNNA